MTGRARFARFVRRRAALEAYLATEEQWAYLRRLMNEAFANHYANTPNLDVHHRPTNYGRAQASADIDRLKRAQARGWRD